MISIDKVEIFSMVVQAMDKNDMRTASDLMKIISKSIDKEKKSNQFSFEIKVDNKKDEKLIRKLREES